MTERERDSTLPEHMDRWSRNQRLYETLKGMGLYVSPIPEDHDPTKIREMIVSADLPTCGVDVPVERPEVGDVVGPTVRDAGNVVLFPPKV